MAGMRLHVAASFCVTSKFFNTYGLPKAKYRKCFPSHILELKIKSSLQREWKSPHSSGFCGGSCVRSLSTAGFSLQHWITPNTWKYTFWMDLFMCQALVLQGSVEASCELSLFIAGPSVQHLTTPGYLSSSFCMTRMSSSLAGC